MNLVAFSLRTKGVHNFARRLWTVFARFGFSEGRTRRDLQTIIERVKRYGSAPTFFIPAVVLGRHPALMSKIVAGGTELGIHGYVHNDYRTLSEDAQYTQTQQAIAIFHKTNIPYYGFRNPYLGWTEASLRVFTRLDFAYESNEAVLHEVIAVDKLQPFIRSGYEKSLSLFQAIPSSAYALRPHFEDGLLRIPTSIPDDEMIFDRLRITDTEEVGRIWSEVMARVYACGGIYTLNLHPERGRLCAVALEHLLAYASSRSRPVWITRLGDVADWWHERQQFRLEITSLAAGKWRVEAACTERATLLARGLRLEEQVASDWSEQEQLVTARQFTAHAGVCPCLGLSLQTPEVVLEFLQEQGYPVKRAAPDEAADYALYLDLPEGLGDSRAEQLRLRSELVARLDALEVPLLRFGNWPNAQQAALAISGDIDSVTIQDFFMRVLEVRQAS